MLPRMDAISLSFFRQHMARSLKLVTEEEGNIWLMKRRKPVAAVVTMKDAHVLGEVQGRSMKELMDRLSDNLARMQAAKAVEEEYDQIKMAEERYRSGIVWSPGSGHGE